MRKALSVFLLFIAVGSSAQSLEGIIVNQKNNTPLPFVNIGIPLKNIGSVSQIDGSFLITIPEANDHDTLQFSMLGFETKKILVADIKKQMQAGKLMIRMEEKSIALHDVIITPKRIRTDILGNVYDSRFITAAFSSEMLGCEMATVMKVHGKKEYYLKSAGIIINSCTYDSIIFRFNIYKYENGMPGSIINTQPIYVVMEKKDREIKINLLPYNITVTDDFVVSLEWIQDVEGSHKGIGFCGGFFGAKLFYKDTSLNSWETAPAGISVGMYCVADYEK